MFNGINVLLHKYAGAMVAMAFVISFATSPVTTCALGGVPAPEAKRLKAVTLHLDVSGSMKGRRAQSMFEAAKLCLAILDPDREVFIVPFNHAAKVRRFKLTSLAERQEAMRFIDDLPIDGGTDYLAALKAIQVPPGTPSIFLSDGEHNGDPAQVLAFLKARKGAPLFTVAVEAPASADKLLAEMAALTGGSHVRVDRSEALIKVFLDIAKNLGHYRSYSPKENKVECKDVVGKLIAFGFDARPEVSTGLPLASPASEHQALLPGEHVQLMAVDLGKPTLVTIEATQKRSAQGRLAAILRQDLLRASMKVHAPEGKIGAGRDLKVATQFFDRHGKPVDPRKRSDLSSIFYLLDQSGKILQQVLAKPSATEAALEAVVTLPKAAGPVTIRNVTKDASEGPAFEAEENRTLVLHKPVLLTVQPDKIALTVREGSFSTSLTVKVQHPTSLPATFSATLEGPPALKLQESRSHNDTLEMDFEAPAGSYQGTVVIHGIAALPLETIRVPIEVVVKERSLGLALPAKRALKLGAVLAHSGLREIATLEFPSLDADAEPYTVDVEDLSNGSSVIPCQADRVRIAPSKAKPASVTLTADVGNVPTGIYSATVIVRSSAGAARLWRTTLTLPVTEPLSAAPLDFGTVEAGKVAKRSLVLKNAGAALADVRLVVADISGQGGDIVVSVLDKIDVAARKTADATVTVTVSPLLESRGVHKGILVLRRIAQQEIKVPLQIDIVGAGEGPRSLLVAPARILLRGKPGEVQEFVVRTKFSVAADAATEELSAEAGAFKDDNGKPLNLEVAFKWAPSAKLTKTEPVMVQGFLVVPDRRGIFTATVTIRSATSGSVVLPLTLEVP